MDYGPYVVPQSTAQIWQNAAATQVPLISQPKGFSGALPGIGTAIQGGLDAATSQQKQKSVMAAQQAYSQYLAKVDDGTATQQDHAMGRMAALSLGIQPPDTLGMNLKKSEIAKNQAQTGELNALAKKNSNPTAPKGAAFPPAAVDAWVKKLTTVNPKTGQPYAVLSDIPGGMSANSLRAQVAAKVSMDPNYDVGSGATGRAGAMTGTRFNFGGDAQKSARAANTVIMLTGGLQQASNGYPRSSVRWFNTPLNAINEQTGNDAMRFKQYLVDTRSKMATALQGGGVPQAEAQKVIAENFPDTMTPRQVPGAIATVKDIMKTQISGALTPVTAAQGQTASNPHPQDSQAVQWARANPNDPRAANILQLNDQ